MILQLEDIKDLAFGAAFLGTGGGGDPYPAQILLEQAIRDGRHIEIMSLDDLADDALIVPFAMVGAPTIGLEKLPCKAAANQALKEMERVKGRFADAIIAAEIGGFNGMMPMVMAGQTGVPVIDGDGMGRAFPEGQMVSFNIAGIDANPIIITDEYSNSVVINARDADDAERLSRGVVTAMGGVGHVVDYPMTGSEAKRAVVPGSVSLALNIGRSVRVAHENGEDPFEAVHRYLSDREGISFANVLFSGKITDVSRETKASFVFGKIRIESFDGSADMMEIQVKNENLVAYLNGKLKAIVPDLICILDSETAKPITTEALKYGQRVKVFGISAAPMMCTVDALKVVGPQAFGLDESYVPLSEIRS